MKINSAFVFLFLVLLNGCIGENQKRTPYRYLIPSGYVGWVEVRFGFAGEPELPIHEGFRIVRFSKEGILKTSSRLENGWAKDEYYYYDGEEKKKLSDGYKTGMINAGSSGIRAIDGRQSLWFFVGNYDQYMKYGYNNATTPTIGPIKQ
jgi:Family of unknown function (DUF6843)